VRKRQHQESPHASACQRPIGCALIELRDLRSLKPDRDQSLPDCLLAAQPPCHCACLFRSASPPLHCIALHTRSLCSIHICAPTPFPHTPRLACAGDNVEASFPDARLKCQALVPGQPTLSVQERRSSPVNVESFLPPHQHLPAPHQQQYQAAFRPHASLSGGGGIEFLIAPLVAPSPSPSAGHLQDAPLAGIYRCVPQPTTTLAFHNTHQRSGALAAHIR
jgi:hypothetical protein